MTGKVVILMGSERDLELCQEIAKHLKAFGLKHEFRVASAHKTPDRVLEILREFEEQKIVYITPKNSAEQTYTRLFEFQAVQPRS
jgi:5-(carboxyamino)imidazole ribonucleotide mutase